MHAAFHVPSQQVQQQFFSFARTRPDASLSSRTTAEILHDLWLGLRFRTDTLRLANGQRLQIIDPGLPGRPDGPDFQDATLIIGGTEIRGDIAVHPTSSCWFDQQCHLHDAYRHTVLHVTLYADFWTGGLLHPKGRVLDELVLCRYLDPDHCARLRHYCQDHVFETG